MHTARFLVPIPIAALAAIASLSCGLIGSSGPRPDWPAYGGGPQSIRYSGLNQIDRSNVAELEVAWTYDTGEDSGASQTQPITVDGVLCGLTPSHRAIVLDAAAGDLLWRFDSVVEGRGPNRGVRECSRPDYPAGVSWTSMSSLRRTRVEVL